MALLKQFNNFHLFLANLEINFISLQLSQNLRIIKQWDNLKSVLMNRLLPQDETVCLPWCEISLKVSKWDPNTVWYFLRKVISVNKLDLDPDSGYMHFHAFEMNYTSQIYFKNCENGSDRRISGPKRGYDLFRATHLNRTRKCLSKLNKR